MKCEDYAAGYCVGKFLKKKIYQLGKDNEYKNNYYV